jgi:DNA-binding NtrC family response regulator
MAKLLVVDDDVKLLRSLKELLTLENYEVEATSNPMVVENLTEENLFDCILLDIRMPGLNGLEVLKRLQQNGTMVPVIIISGQSSIDTAVNSIKEGAYDYLEKPIDPDRLLITIRNAIQRQNLIEQKNRLLQEFEKDYMMIGESTQLQKIFREIEAVANTNARVLIEGESGTGKELVARALHFKSDRNSRPYVKLNCAAIPNELLESELFGYTRGAFTGATNTHQGRFLQAHTGTLFLDEIGDMDFMLQSKILRVLEEGEVQMLGTPETSQVNVRFIAATNKDLEKLVREEKFRRDLYHRLNVVRIYIPPLRNRKADILPLAYHFLKQYAEEHNKAITKFNNQAESYLISYQWPGNVRELRNLIEKIVIFSTKPEIALSTVQSALNPLHTEKSNFPNLKNSLPTLKEATTQFEKEYITTVLDKTSGKVADAADLLGMNRTSLFRLRKKYNI